MHNAGFRFNSSWIEPKTVQREKLSTLSSPWDSRSWGKAHSKAVGGFHGTYECDAVTRQRLASNRVKFPQGV